MNGTAPETDTGMSQACDCHFHVFGPAGTYPMSPDRIYTPGEASFESYGAVQAVLGTRRGIVVQPSVYGYDNRATLDTVARSPETLRAVVAVPDEIEDAALARLDAAGARALRINLVGRVGRILTLRDLAQRIAGLGWHIEIFLHWTDLAAVRDLLDGLPVPVVLDHFGGLSTGVDARTEGLEILLSVTERPDTWVKLSAPYRLMADDGAAQHQAVIEITQRLIEAMPDRLIWGSDWPHPYHDRKAPEPVTLTRLLREACPTAEAYDRIMARNAAILYGFDISPDTWEETNEPYR
ncbi:amidohydrolase [Sedimentitalea sp. XS_ASV28]|uniref:amidohydrolase family protein n=1 Tax=Sedimentitalea sp. XS_ASV28 TaxID=3241296 RepID=UPI0035127677